jgi:murein DD-endopeptidase MepM/ murein hydrolase activator NlpD
LNRATALRPRAALSAQAIDPGLDPPIVLDGSDARAYDRRAVSLRWLAGSILVGLTGGGLMASAILAALDGDWVFAERAEVASPSVSRNTAGATRSRGDRLVTAPDPAMASAKQGFRAATTIKVGDREVVRLKPFVRVAANLSATPLGFAADVPQFNVMRMFNTAGAAMPAPAAIDNAESAQGDAEISFQKRSVSGDTGADSGLTLEDNEVSAQVEDIRRAFLEAGRTAALLPIPAQQMLLSSRGPGFAPVLGLSPTPETSFSSIEVKVVPENVTDVPKASGNLPAVLRANERVVALKRGENPEQMFRANGASQADARAIIAIMTGRMGALKETVRFKLLIAPKDGQEPEKLLRVTAYEDDAIRAIAAIDDRHEFVSVEPPALPAKQDATDDEDEEIAGDNLRLFESLYETGLKNEVPKSVIDQIVRVFFYDFDLQRRVAATDSFEVFWAEDDDNPGRIDILYASLNTGGQIRRYYRYQTPDEGIEFLDDSGKSSRRFLLRKPITDGELRSGFGMRYHPILRYSRLHSGVDWSNKIGTPIMAAGDGIIIKAEWDSGYGRRVEIQHPYNFVTTYSHMNGFAKGVAEGARVRQGQIIGYLGRTGLSTGPHLHYEVLVNDNFVDPMSIRLPRGRELDQRQLAEFRKERERIDDIMRKAPQATRISERASLR